MQIPSVFERAAVESRATTDSTPVITRETPRRSQLFSPIIVHTTNRCSVGPAPFARNRLLSLHLMITPDSLIITRRYTSRTALASIFPRRVLLALHRPTLLGWR